MDTARPRPSRPRLRLLAPLAALSLMAAGLAIAPASAENPTQGPSSSSAVEPPRPAFYEAPAALPARNGDVIRQQPLRYALDPAGAAALVKDSRTVMYRSTNRAGRAIAVTGTLIVPKAPWLGRGKRPVIGYAAGTQGQGDRCAPSRYFSDFFEYEGLVMAPLLARGYAIAMTDYEGLGTAGIHTYMDRVAQGRAVLDMVRAAQRMGVSGIDASNPIGLQGYSQGGGAAASAAELASSYAPELPIKGAVVGAVPGDLSGLISQIDGSMYSLFALFALNGLTTSYSLDLGPSLNQRGVDTLASAQQDCVFDLFSKSFTQTKTLTRDGRPISALASTQPFKQMLADQTIGTMKPSMPVLVDHSLLDDVIPHAAGKAVAKRWCGKGAKVRFATNSVPSHAGAITAHVTEASPFWEARFGTGLFLSNCWLL